MQFVFFHLMSWPTYTRVAGEDWPAGNRSFDPETGTDLYRTYLDQMAHAEECGFDWVGCNEHHFSPHGLMPNSNLIGAALTQRTRRVRLAMVGNLVPLLNPIRVAEEYAMLDVMSGGRLVAGFMRGIPHEYVAYNVSADESWGRFREAFQLIRKAWTEPQPFGWEGEFFRFRAVSIWPKPRQRPHPPILMSASNPESARFAGSNRVSMGMVHLPDLDRALEVIEVYRQTARQHGWEPAPGRVLVGVHACISEDGEEARERLAVAESYHQGELGGGLRTAQRIVLQRSRYYRDQGNATTRTAVRGEMERLDIGERIARSNVVCGTPDEVAEQIERIHAALGNGVLLMNFHVGLLPDDVIRRGMRLFRDRVLPRVRHLGEP